MSLHAELKKIEINGRKVIHIQPIDKAKHDHVNSKPKKKPRPKEVDDVSGVQGNRPGQRRPLMRCSFLAQVIVTRIFCDGKCDQNRAATDV